MVGNGAEKRLRRRNYSERQRIRVSLTVNGRAECSARDDGRLQDLANKAYRGFAPGHLYRLVPHRLFLDAQVAHVFKLRESSRNDITVIPCHYNVAIIST